MNVYKDFFLTCGDSLKMRFDEDQLVWSPAKAYQRIDPHLSVVLILIDISVLLQWKSHTKSQ